MRRIWQKNLPTLVQFFTATGSRTFCKFAEGQLGADEKLLKMRTLRPRAVNQDANLHLERREKPVPMENRDSVAKRQIRNALRI
jgi:hypothetical protein